jgi:hypothetical protein
MAPFLRPSVTAPLKEVFYVPILDAKRGLEWLYLSKF